jgi:hypothetical protein
MPSLAEAQAAFAAALEASSSEGLRAYRANVRGNWSGALAGAYPIVRKIVGEGFFEALAHAYADAHPSCSGDLNQYGEHFAHLLSRLEQTEDVPYLPDVARMEWLAHRAYYAADPRPFEARGDPAAWRLALAPPCALLASPWPLARLWEVHQDDYRGPLEVDVSLGGDRILVYRPRWRAAVCALGEGDYRFLRAAKRRATLEEALREACTDPAFDAGAAPARWLEKGVIEL